MYLVLQMLLNHYLKTNNISVGDGAHTVPLHFDSIFSRADVGIRPYFFFEKIFCSLWVVEDADPYNYLRLHYLEY